MEKEEEKGKVEVCCGEVEGSGREGGREGEAAAGEAVAGEAGAFGVTSLTLGRSFTILLYPSLPVADVRLL